MNWNVPHKLERFKVTKCTIVSSSGGERGEGNLLQLILIRPSINYRHFTVSGIVRSKDMQSYQQFLYSFFRHSLSAHNVVYELYTHDIPFMSVNT